MNEWANLLGEIIKEESKVKLEECARDSKLRDCRHCLLHPDVQCLMRTDSFENFIIVDTKQS